MNGFASEGSGRGRERRPAARERGFTLIELLVVIAVLALLVSILAPSLQEAMRYSRLVACRMNVRNLSMACMIYVNDNHEYFVGNDWDQMNMVKATVNGKVKWGWAGHLAADRALEQGGILMCPGFRMPNFNGLFLRNNRRRLEGSAENWVRATGPEWENVRLWSNYAVHTDSHTNDFYVEDNHFSAMFPERRIMMAEAISAFFAGGSPSAKPSDLTYGLYHGPSFDSEINIAFSDGSIESIKDYSDTDRWSYTHAGNPFYYYPNNERYSWGFWRVFRYGPRPK